MEEIVKVIAVIGSLTALLKIFSEIASRNLKRHRDDYEFLKVFLDDLESDEIHPYIKEKGFRSITGETLSLPEINFLVSRPKPSQTISDRISSGGHIEFDDLSGRYSWCGILRIRLIRKFSGIGSLLAYFLFAMTALWPTLFSVQILGKGMTTYLYYFVLISLALSSLIWNIKSDAAIKFMEVVKNDELSAEKNQKQRRISSRGKQNNG